MAREDMDALTDACQRDAELAADLSVTRNAQEWVRVANQRGFAVTVEDLPAPAKDAELSDSELAGMAGGIGLTFLPHTNWIFCDNPWTDWYCTYKC